MKAEADESRLKSLHSPALFSVKVQPHTSLCCYLQKQNVNCFVTLRQHGRRADIGVLLCKVTKTPRPPPPPLIWWYRKQKKNPPKAAGLVYFLLSFMLAVTFSQISTFPFYGGPKGDMEGANFEELKMRGTIFPKSNDERNGEKIEKKENCRVKKRQRKFLKSKKKKIFRGKNIFLIKRNLFYSLKKNCNFSPYLFFSILFFFYS